MAAPQNFRSAFNGFNREDVVHYIEYLSAKHTAELNQLNAETEFLRTKLDSAGQDSQLQALLTAAEEQRDAYKEQLEELEKRCAVLEEERDTALELADSTADTKALEEKIASLQQELDAALTAKAQSERQQQSAINSRVEQELEAYRRAERTERQARERADLLCQQANGALADATARVDEAAAQVSELTDRVMYQLGQLQTAIIGSKQTLRDATSAMYAIRPGSTED